MSPGSEVRRRIEELAANLVVSEAAGRGAESLAKIAAALDAIAGGARESGLLEVAQLAAALRRELQTPDAGETLEECMLNGIASLQDACERAGAPSAGAPGPAQPRNDSLANDPELLRDFVLESRDHLASIEAQALVLEREPLDGEALNSAFRSFHTIKGLAGFLELWEVQALAHEVEALLDLARRNELRIGRPAIDVFLESADCLRGWLTYLDSTLGGTPQPAPPRNQALLNRIQSLAAGAAAEIPDAGVEPSPAPPPAPETAPPAPGAARARSGRAEASAVKVDTSKLDYLVDMAGEMVIAESLVQHDPDLSAVKTPRLQRNLVQLGRITAELQKTAMSMRLVPIGPLFRRNARLVRDLSRQFGKQVALETEGDDIHLDRTIVEELADPLMHMVRNAIDHGIETPAERERAGKPPAARLTLKAMHQAGQVVVEIGDDGRGLNRDRIFARAVEKGLVSADAVLGDSEVYNLIFEPGFTTADQVTNVSGRGVGMDVVRRHVQALRGRIEVRTTLGQGSAFFLKLPLTLAIIDGLVVGVGSDRYILPLFAVREIFRPGEDVVWTVHNRGEMALVRGGLLPVTRLYRRFGVTPRSENPLECVLVVAESEGRRFCLMVDELIGKQEVVIKSLGETFKHVAGVAGGAILGDGRVGLILDLEGVAREGRGGPG